MNTISIIGSGGMAAAIAVLAATSGLTVEVMSRNGTTARALAEGVGGRTTTGVFGAAPVGEIVILAVPYSAALDVVHQYGDSLAGKILVDITNPVAADLTRLVTPADSFGAQEIARAAPASAVIVKAFNTLFANVLATGAIQGHRLDVFLAGDDAQAKSRVAAFIESLGLRPLDAGLLPMARTLEHVCLLSLGLLAHSIRHTNFSISVSPPG